MINIAQYNFILRSVNNIATHKLILCPAIRIAQYNFILHPIISYCAIRFYIASYEIILRLMILLYNMTPGRLQDAI